MNCYIVANNAFTISVLEGLTAWDAIEPHYRPFVADSAAAYPVLSIDIRCAVLPAVDGEWIYEPEFGGIGFIAARAARATDGTLTMEFRHVATRQPHLVMLISPTLDRAEITIARNGDDDDPYFLTHAIMLAYMLATIGNGTLLLHTAAVVCDGHSYLFQGKSGTGKSTHAALWVANIPGAELLNDDHPVVRFTSDERAIAYGSPWSGKTPCYRNLSAPIGAIVRIVRAEENELRPLAPLHAFASLTPSVFYLPLLNDAQRAARHAAVERLAATVPCYEMHCRPDADAARCCSAVLGDQTAIPHAT